MKNVLSPSSDRKMSENAARKPDLPSAEFARYDCVVYRASVKRYWLYLNSAGIVKQPC